MDIPGFLLFCVFLHDFQKNMRFWNQIRRLWYFFKLTLESVKVYRFHVRTMHTLLRQAVHDIIHIMSWTAFLNEKMYDRRTIRKSCGNWKSEDSGKTENLLAVPVWLREYMHRGRFSPEKRTYEELWMQKTDPTPGKTPRSHRTAVRQACRSGTGSGNGRKMWWRSGAKRIVRSSRSIQKRKQPMESLHWLSGKILQSWQLRNLWGGSSGAAGRGKAVIWSIFSEISRRKFLRTQGDHNTDKNTSNRRNTGQLCYIECSLGSDFYKFLRSKGERRSFVSIKRQKNLVCSNWNIDSQ